MKLLPLGLAALFLLLAPCLSSAQPVVTKLTAQETGQEGHFGSALALDGERVVVGYEVRYGLAQGGVDILERSPKSPLTWEVVSHKLPCARCWTFGSSVAIDEDTIAVGTVDDTDDWPLHGSLAVAHVFERNAGGPDAWGLVARIVPSGNDYYFFTPLDLSGHTLVIGQAGYYSNDIYHAPYVALFERNAGGSDTWGEVVQIAAPDGITQFADVVAVDKNTLAVGPGHLCPSPDETRAVYVYERDPAEPYVWLPSAEIIPPGCESCDMFGTAVALEGDILVVTDSFSGTAFIFERNEGGPDNWGCIGKLTSPEPDASFGESVSITDSRIAIGAPSAETVYVYDRNVGGTNNWGLVSALKQQSPQGESWMGYSVAMDSDTVVTGAPNDDTVADPLGSVHIFDRISLGPDITANASDGPVVLPQGDPLSVAGSLWTGIYEGLHADWWALAETPGGWYHYTLDGTWLPGMAVTHQGPLMDLSPYEVLNIRGLPMGSYRFHFGVDTDMDGALSSGEIFSDDVAVEVQ